MKSEHSIMTTEREEQSLKMYALKILCSIVKKLNLYIQKDILKDDDDTTTLMNESTLNAAFERLGSKDSRLDQYGFNHQKKTEIQKAAIKFNIKPKNGIAYLIKIGFISSEP
jgi:Sec7-like guanine-nucleotide exchange factor